MRTALKRKDPRFSKMADVYVCVTRLIECLVAHKACVDVGAPAEYQIYALARHHPSLQTLLRRTLCGGCGKPAHAHTCRDVAAAAAATPLSL